MVLTFLALQGTGFDEDPNSPQSAAAVARARRKIHICTIVAFVALVILWPLLTLPAGVWSKGGTSCRNIVIARLVHVYSHIHIFTYTDI